MMISADQIAGRDHSVTEMRAPTMRKPPKMATDSARIAIVTARPSSARAHTGSFTRVIVSAFARTALRELRRDSAPALLGASLERDVLDANSFQHQPTKPNRRQNTGDRRPHDQRDARDLAG